MNRIFITANHAPRCHAGSKSRWALSLSEITVGVDRPFQLKRRVVVADTTLVLRRIKLVDEVERLGVIRERMKPCAKPLGTYIIRRFSAVNSAPKL